MKKYGDVEYILREAGHRRGIEELVEVVEMHPDFQGTSIVFNSRLWDLFELNSISEAEVLKRIDEMFLDHQVKRHPSRRLESWRYGRNPEIDVQHPVSPLEMLGLRAAIYNSRAVRIQRDAILAPALRNELKA